MYKQKRSKLLMLIFLFFFLITSCQKEENYYPIKKTGDEAIAETSFSEKEEQAEGESAEEESNEEKSATAESIVQESNFDNFEKHQIFRVVEDEILIRDEPSIDGEIIKYFSLDEEVIVVDKYIDEEGDTWYVLRLFDDDLTYGFTFETNIERVREE